MKLISRQADHRFWFLRLDPPYDTAIPDFGSPFVTVVVACDPTITPKEQADISTQLVAKNCRYVLAWGINSSSWDDSVDMAYIATDPEFNPPNDRMVMTTWHDDESLPDVVWFALHNTNFDSYNFHDYLALMIGANVAIETELIAAIRDQLLPPIEVETSDALRSPFSRKYESESFGGD